MWDKNIQVKLIIPKEKSIKSRTAPDYLKYNGMTGRIVSPAGKGGVWVSFVNDVTKYVGCPLEFIQAV